MKKNLFLAASLICSFGFAQTFTWNGAGVTNNLSEAANWVGGVAPQFTLGTEDLVFDGTGTKNCDFDVASIDVASFSMNAGYTGTINAMATSPTIEGNIVIGAGTFISTSAEMVIGGNFTRSGTGVFAHNNGTVSLFANSGATVTIAGTPTFNVLGINPTGLSSTQRNIDFGGCTADQVLLQPTNRIFGYKNTVNITTLLSIAGTNIGTPAGNTGVFNFIGNNVSISSTSGAGQSKLGNITVNTSGTFAVSGNVALTGTWTNSNIGSFTAGTSTVSFYGSSGIISSGNTAATRAYFDNLTVASSSTLGISGSSQIDMNGTLTHNGVLNTNTSLIIFSGAGAQSIAGSASSTTINALMITGTGNKSFGHATLLLDSVKISSAGTLVGTNLTLHSTSALKARLAQITGGGSVSGNLTVETYAPGGTTDWAVLGVSGIQGQTFNNWYGQIPMAIKGSTTAPGSTGGQWFNSVQGWNESDAYGYDTTVAITTALTPGEGFWVYLGTSQGTTAAMTWSVTGSAVTGNVNIPLTNSAQSGYNLISNPYASPISWAKLRNGNASVNNAIYIYNADLGVTTSYVNGVSDHPGQGANDVIPMGQGFYVQATGNTNLTAQESNKVSSNTSANPLLKTTNINSYPPNVIGLKIQGLYDWDQTAINFLPGSTNGFDGEYDAHKWYNSPGYIGYPGVWTKRTSVSTMLGGDDYAINSLPPSGQNMVIPVRALAYLTGQYTISAVDLQNIPNNVCVLLKDKATNTTQDLRTGPYSFNLADTTSAPRFELTVCSLAIPTGIKQQSADNSAVAINQDKTGATVSLNFPASTEATISVTNILGEKILADKKVVAASDDVRLDLSNFSNQVLIISVRTSNSLTTKKIVR